MDKRALARVLCLLIAIGCFGYIGFYSYQKKRTEEKFNALSEINDFNFDSDEPMSETVVLKKSDKSGSSSARKLFILKQYRGIYKKNKSR